MAASGPRRTGRSNAWLAGREGSLGQVCGLSEKGILVAAGRSEDGVMESQLLNPPQEVGFVLGPRELGFGEEASRASPRVGRNPICFGNSLGVRCRQGVNSGDGDPPGGRGHSIHEGGRGRQNGAAPWHAGEWVHVRAAV